MNRILGTVGMIGAPMLLVEALYRSRFGVTSGEDDVVVGALELIYVAGWASSAVGMRLSRVTGSGPGSAAVFVVQMIGLVLAGSFALQGMLQLPGAEDTVFHGITDAAWPLSHLFMLVVGVFVARAGVWRGWRRLGPLVCGLALPATMALVVAAGEALLPLFPALTATGFLLLGLALRSHPPG